MASGGLGGSMPIVAMTIVAMTIALLGLCGHAIAQELTPPQIVSLPPVEVPADLEIGVDSLEVRVEIDADGAASMIGCDAEEALCALARTAVEAARFRPALRDGASITSQVAVRLDLRAPEDVASDTARLPPDNPFDDGDGEEPARELTFGAVASVEALPEPGARRLELQELRSLPGTFGDPFRAVLALPGVVPVLSGLPYFYLRGSPPSGTLYTYDDIPIPALYHLAAGPAVVHPRMIGDVHLFAGVAPARYGRLTGGTIVGEGPDFTDVDEIGGEVELRLIDANAFLQVPIDDDVVVSAAGRFGYPGLLLSLFSPEIDLAYWDYQLRVDAALSARDRATVLAFGAFDSFSQVDEDTDNRLAFQFHRLEARLARRIGPTEIGAALRVGYDESSFDDDLAVESVSVGPRAWLTHRRERVRLRVGADLTGIVGSIGLPDDSDTAPIDNPLYTAVAGRSLGGVHVELVLLPHDLVEIALGGRGDFWLTGKNLEGALDPRARVTVHADDRLAVHAAAGVVRQPAVFFFPLPGLADVALDRGLQTAVQTELGASWEVDDSLSVEGQLFFHHYDDLLFLDVAILDDELCFEFDDVCREIDVDPRTTGNSWGAELFVRRSPGPHRVSGWVSYTLSWADVDDVLQGTPYTPAFDVRHVLNAVVAWRLGWGFDAGMRLHLRSGKTLGEWEFRTPELSVGRYEQELPWFFRADAQVSYTWRTSWGRLRVALEWFNLTFAEEPIGLECEDDRRPCDVEYAPALFFPNLGIRGEF